MELKDNPYIVIGNPYLMYLTRDEQAILDGEQGAGAQKAMELVTALGKIYGADSLVDITSAHLSGASYKTIGEGGLKYLSDMVAGGATVAVPSTLNPVGMDRTRWKEMHISPEFAEKQLQIIDLYGKMGIKKTCSCTPYLGDNVPALGDHVAWAESSALSFVNSYIGARTNREGGPGALAAAILGKTANYGLHLDENRAPTVVIDVENIEDSVFDYSLLGQAFGMKIGKGVPYFRGINPTVEDAKTLSAAMAAAGAVALWHAEGCTPEAGNFDISGLEHITIGKKERKEAFEKLNTADDVELIAIGCPHLTPKEMHDIATLLKGKEKKRKDVEIWFCTSESVREQCPEDVKIIEKFGPVLADTCMVVAPIETTFKRTGTNSAKAGNYLPTLCSQKVVFSELSDLLKVVE
jgi:predicted aconitase